MARKQLGVAPSGATDTGTKGYTDDRETAIRSDVTTAISGVSNQISTVDTNIRADVTTALAGKANTSHTHTASQVTDFSTAADARITAATGTSVQAYSANLTTLAGKTAPTGALVGDTDTQTLTNKTLTAPALSGTVTGTYTLGGTPTFPSSVVSLTGTQTLTNKTLTAPRVNQLNDTNGVQILNLTPIASAVNYLQIQNNVTAGWPSLRAVGSDTNVGIDIVTKGTGIVKLNGVEGVTISGTQTLTNKTLTAPRADQINDTNGNAILLLTPTTSAVNYVQVVNAATGNAASIRAAGTDTNVSLNLIPKGTGALLSNGIAVPTISSTDTLTNKTISGSNNTLSNISADSTVDGTTNKVYTATEKTKLAGISAGATVTNSSTVAAAGAEMTVNRNAVNGYAGLDSSGLIPSTLLPSYVSDVIEAANLASFPATGQSAKIYVAINTGKTYRWSGSTYSEISPSPGSTDSVVEGSVNLYYTQARVDARADARITAATGVSVQAYSSTLTTWAGKTPPSGTVVGTTDTQTLSNKFIQDAKIDGLSDMADNQILGVSAQPNAVNYIALQNAASGGSPSLFAEGSGTNLDLYVSPKGTGAIKSYVPSGQAMTFAADGGDANVSINLIPKGTGVVAANNVPVLTTTGTQTVTNKTIVHPATASPTYQAGKLVYDTDNESLTFFNNDSNISLQIGQEMWIRVRNETGSTIANGAAVYISGTHASGLPQVSLAQSNAAATTICVGLATEAIPTGTIGYITSMGIVRGIDTSAFTAGMSVYVSAATPGALTTTMPASPNYRYRVGIVASSNATTGSVHVTPSTAMLASGSANQLFGYSATGTQENKTISGSQGVSVTHTPNNILLTGTSQVRDVTVTQSATPAINTDNTDQATITGLAQAITSMSSGLTGTPTNGQKLMIRIKDNGTARAITWGTSFQSSGVATLLTTTVVNKTHHIGFVYDSTVAKFICVAVDAVGY